MAELGQRMSKAELTRWMAFYKLEADEKEEAYNKAKK